MGDRNPLERGGSECQKKRSPVVSQGKEVSCLDTFHFAPKFFSNDSWALFGLIHRTQKEKGAVFLETVSLVQRRSHLWIPDREATALSAVIVCLLRLGPPLSDVFSDFEAVSELPVVFCNDIHVHNLENKLFTLKVGYVIVSLNPSTTLPTACVQVLDVWLITHGNCIA